MIICKFFVMFCGLLLFSRSSMGSNAPCFVAWKLKLLPDGLLSKDICSTYDVSHIASLVSFMLSELFSNTIQHETLANQKKDGNSSIC